MMENRKERRENVLNVKRFFSASVENSDSDKPSEPLCLLPEELEILVRNLQRICSRQSAIVSLRRFVTDEIRVTALCHVESSMRSIVSILINGTSDVQVEAAWCLTNIAAGSHKHTKSVLKAAGAYLVTFLESFDQRLQDPCAWAVGNIASDCKSFRQVLFAQGAVHALILLLDFRSQSVGHSALFALANITLDVKDDVMSAAVTSGIVLKVVQLSRVEKMELGMLTELTRLMMHICSWNNRSFRESVASHELISSVVNLLEHLIVDMQLYIAPITWIVRAIANFLESGPCIEDEHVASLLPSLLSSGHDFLTKELLWCLANLTASHPSMLSEHKILPIVVSLLSCKATDVRREAGIVIMNAVCQVPGFDVFAVDLGILHPMIELLKSTEIHLLKLGIQFFDVIMASCIDHDIPILRPVMLSVVKDIKSLCDHPKPQIQRWTQELIKMYKLDET
ncbi:importin subunit alpha-8-like [Corticium candelabrum]|uniref:importin subunit alpha-8-like n=1 Tax=Corticium candelabrum TaxID=121492 RepID=UPI002E2774DB|nr:importin subunit alpha-8-like [Corticium candelabrum]